MVSLAISVLLCQVPIKHPLVGQIAPQLTYVHPSKFESFVPSLSLLKGKPIMIVFLDWIREPSDEILEALKQPAAKKAELILLRPRIQVKANPLKEKGPQVSEETDAKTISRWQQSDPVVMKRVHYGLEPFRSDRNYANYKVDISDGAIVVLAPDLRIQSVWHLDDLKAAAKSLPPTP